jgi:hypothetical protein
MPKPAVFGPIPTVVTPSYRGSAGPPTAVVPRSRGLASTSPQQATRRLIIDASGAEGSFSQIEIEGDGVTAIDMGNGRLKLTIEGGGSTSGSGELGQSNVPCAGDVTLSAAEAAKGIIVLDDNGLVGNFQVNFPDVDDNETEAYTRVVFNNTPFTAVIQTVTGVLKVLQGTTLSQSIRFSDAGAENNITGV